MSGKRINVNGELFSELLQEKLSDEFKKRIDQREIYCYEASEEEKESCILKCVKAIISENLVEAGEHRREQWEQGWNENLEILNESLQKAPDDKSVIASTIPKYYGKYDYCQLNQQFVRVGSRDYEHHVLSVLVEWVYERLLKGCRNIYEFGCGTGQNLLTLRELIKEYSRNTKLYGLDWTEASQSIIKAIGGGTRALSDIISTIFTQTMTSGLSLTAEC